MRTKTIHSLTDIQVETGESRHIINFLVRDRQIPFELVGNAKILHEEGRNQLLRAIAEYRARSKRQPKAASAS